MSGVTYFTLSFPADMSMEPGCVLVAVEVAGELAGWLGAAWESVPAMPTVWASGRTIQECW